MNIIQIAGHLGTEPDSRVTPSGQKVTSFSIASNSRESGQEVTTWYRITVWGDRFEKMMTYLKKGSAVIVVGELRSPRMYTDKNGNQQVSLDVTAEMLRFAPFGRKDESAQSGGYAAAPQATPQATPAASSFGGMPAATPAPAADPFGAPAASMSTATVTDDNLPF